MKKNKYPVTRMLTTEQIKRMENLAEINGESQSEVIGNAIDEAFYRDCAKREGISYEEWLAKEAF